jgi:hypothetical protein
MLILDSMGINWLSQQVPFGYALILSLNLDQISQRDNQQTTATQMETQRRPETQPVCAGG